MLKKILDEAAAGVFPPATGSVTVVPQPHEREAGVIAFSAHAVVFTDEDPDWIRETIAASPADRLAAPHSPSFLSAFAERTGRVVNTIDLLTVSTRLPGEPPLPVRPIEDREHPRIARALLFRDDVRAWTTPGGVLVLGRGVAGRWEVAIEVDPQARGRGLGRALAVTARHLLPEGEHLWSQQSAGNATSVRAFQAAGYRPVGAEALLVRHAG
ncbi:GNAT family N-acetyltransferase [Kitasatospora sp. GP82]|uniref:GNAT family N-acetyltransferase n=1 Tax=Kitasatospora sp. GP82 TaxID=3035089 RepID=UPI0024752D07|nr:GNAT family N-acetyltransferase [Kitasatospora sp. GP82]MDH6125745.1 GNAT superfamily N-acetyltransferase [Kitasatospora sp. GP82]